VTITPRDFAIQAHGAQRYGQHPYVYHLDQVADLCRPYGEREVAVAYLHDVIEDTATKYADLVAAFTLDIARHVRALTDPPGATRAQRKAAFYENFRVQACRLCPIVKACDRLANVRECSKNNPSLLARYRAEHAEFRSAVFRDGLCDPIWAELDGLMVAS
jgi:(p)ppGpp synthase/HD superfamily hydrolase